MIESSQNLQLVCEVFRRYARKIHKKNNPHDPNFLKISIALGRVSTSVELKINADPLQIEQFIESIFPTQKPPVDKKSPASIEEAARKAKEDAEAKWDMFYMISAVMLTVGTITFFMVGASSPFRDPSINHSTAFRCLDGWRSLRHCLLPGQGAAWRAPWLVVFQRYQDRRSYEDCGGGSRAQRAIRICFDLSCRYVL
jgi:hypothetical protein